MNAEIVAIASRGKSDVEKTRSTLKIGYVLVPGPLPELLKQYGIYNDREHVALPTTMIIDTAGKLRWYYVGANDYDRPRTATIIEELKKLR